MKKYLLILDESDLKRAKQVYKYGEWRFGSNSGFIRHLLNEIVSKADSTIRRI